MQTVSRKYLRSHRIFLAPRDPCAPPSDRILSLIVFPQHTLSPWYLMVFFAMEPEPHACCLVLWFGLPW